MAATLTGADLRKKMDTRLIQRASTATSITPAAAKRLAELEAEAQKEANDNPDFKLQFTAMSDFLQQWALLNPDQQKKLGDQFQERANALVDVPFNQQLTDLRGSLDTQLKTLNQKYQFLSEDEQQKLSTQLSVLDRDTVDQLTKAFTSIEERGLGNSGAMRQMADAIMNNKEDVAKTAREVMQLDLKQGSESLAAGTEAARKEAVIKERGITQDQTVAREVKKNDLVSRAVQKDLLQQIISGATELSPKSLSTYSPSAINPDNLPGADGGSTTSSVANVPMSQRIANVRTGMSGTTPSTPAPVVNVRAPSWIGQASTGPDTSGMTPEQRRAIRLKAISSKI